MLRLRPKEILFTDSYDEKDIYCGQTELRKAKRIDIFGKWYKVAALATKLLDDEGLTFTHEGMNSDIKRRLSFRIYEKTASRLFINVYFGTTQTPKDVYMGTIHIEQFEEPQHFKDFTYKGIIELLVMKEDEGIVEIAPEFKAIQEIKQEFAVAIGMYLLALSDNDWAAQPASDAAKEDASSPLAESHDNIHYLQELQQQLEADKEELLRLRIESNNRKTVQAELERLRQELLTERNERAKDKERFEQELAAKDTYIAKIKETAAKHVEDILFLKNEVKRLQAAVDAAKQQSVEQKPQEAPAPTRPAKKTETTDDTLAIPTFMSQHDYTHDLDALLAHQQICYISDNPEWQHYVARRFPKIKMLTMSRNPEKIIEDSDFLIIHTVSGKTAAFKRAISIAREEDCLVIITTSYNLNNMAKQILQTIR